jgi:hypothetical protein
MNLETYLKQATRGIWGKRRTDAILELRGNIEARIWTLEHQGKTQTEALEIALQEMGDARAVNAGMTQVHTMPNIIRNSLLASLISIVAAIGWTSSTAQIQTVVPNIEGCCRQVFPEIQQTQFINLNDLKSRLEQAGVAVEETMQAPLKTAQRYSRVLIVAKQTRTLDLHFPEMPVGKTVRVQAIPGLTVNADGGNPQFLEDEDVFVDPFSVIKQLREAKLPMSLEGWHNPTLRIGQTPLVIGTTKQPITGASLYSDTLTENIFLGYAGQGLVLAWNQSVLGSQSRGNQIYSMRVNDRPGTVYGLFIPNTRPMSPGPNGKESSWVEYKMARVDDHGVLQFAGGLSSVIQFVKSMNDIGADLKLIETNLYDETRLSNLGYGTTKNPAKVMLVRLTGRLDTNTTEIVVPAKSRLMGLPR